jgi:hypothetical protein
MNLAWKIVVFTLCINVASGILTNFVGIGNNIYNADVNTAILEEDVYGVSGGNVSAIDTIPVTGEVNWADNLLGLLGLGFIVDLVDMLTNYLYGLTTIILAILPVEAQGLATYLNWMITFAYTLSLFSLFTGKNLNSED